MSHVRTAVRLLGELFVTAGVVVLLFVVYQLFWTNVEAGLAQREVASDLRSTWEGSVPVAPEPSASPAGEAPAAPVPVMQAPAVGEGLALLHVPRLGEGWVRPVVEGVDAPELAKGVGHYPDTGLPGQVGNFAVAGHRSTNGEPFRDLDRMRPGDAVVVETEGGWYTYVVDADPFVVLPGDVEVIEPVPGEPGVQADARRLTMTTCHPRWSSAQRLIVHATLTEERAKPAGPPVALAGGA